MFMSVSTKLSKVLEKAKAIPFNENSKFVFMSDCHRGDGSWSDDFLKNQVIYFAALTHYYQKGYTYFELGDGDELWENRKLSQIISVHSNVFWLLSKFYQKGRFHMIYGNHDMVKKYTHYTRQKCCTFYDEVNRRSRPLFPDIEITEGILLKDEHNDRQILLAHGHQGDLMNDTFWKVSRFLIRYIWKPLELIGFNDPTSTAKNYHKKDSVEKKLSHWCAKNNQMLIAGHTHRPVFPDAGKIPYFNCGSCLHPRCITALEIKNNTILLVKWLIQTKNDLSLCVGREILEDPIELSKYFSKEGID